MREYPLTLFYVESHELMSNSIVFRPTVKSRMRLQAAVCLVRLSLVEAYFRVLHPKFLNLALTVQVCFSPRLSSIALVSSLPFGC
jgi:hypothetical protein